VLDRLPRGAECKLNLVIRGLSGMMVPTEQRQPPRKPLIIRGETNTLFAVRRDIAWHSPKAPKSPEVVAEFEGLDPREPVEDELS
jgi:hypothetical protein